MSRSLIFYAGQRAEKIVQKNCICKNAISENEILNKQKCFSQTLRATAGENKNFRRFVKCVNYSCFYCVKQGQKLVGRSDAGVLCSDKNKHNHKI